MEDLTAEFIAETREMLEALAGEIVAWESTPEDKARLDEIFRFVHTVKGNCGFFDLPRLETLSHAAEGALAEVRAGHRIADNALVSAVLAIIDRIAELIMALETGEAVSSADDEQLIQALSESAHATTHPADGTAAAGEARKTLRSIRLSVDLLDRMMSGVSDMVLARNELSRRLRESPDDLGVEHAFERLSACIAEMRDAVTRTRMQRMDSLFVVLPRMVRDIAAELGKNVALQVDGGDVELDREMIEMIRDPLTHIVRNAIDHGLESTPERLKVGKPSNGVLRVSARQSGNQILIEICDDGRGVDGNMLVKKALGSGLISPEQAERMTPAQRIALIFEPGLSTAEAVTAISGRGVGMDVVRANIERIGGVVDVDSRPGNGLRLTLRVPLTLTIIPALTISVAGGNYAIPRSAIEEIVRVGNAMVQVEHVGGAALVSIREHRMPLVSLADVLGVQASAVIEDQSMIILKPAGGDDYALAVDVVHDHEELVVKPAAPVVMATGLYAGTTLADDGRPILLLDPSGIAAQADIVLDQGVLETLAGAEDCDKARREEVPALLFRTRDGSKRAVRLSVVERIEEVSCDTIQRSAGRLRIALGDKILSLVGCGDTVPAGTLQILRLSDGMVELAYGFAEVIDLVTLGDFTIPTDIAGEIGGVTLVNGEQVEVIDSHWLFGQQGRAAPGGLVCALPAGDPWVQNILKPLIEAAGYRTVRTDEAGAVEADLIIAAVDSDMTSTQTAPVLRIRANPEPSGDSDDSIYRYDRAGLLAALRVRADQRKG